MKSRLFSLTIAVWALIYALTAHENIAYGAKDPLASLESIYYVENAPIMRKIRCTCYFGSGITASGQKTRSGIIAGKKNGLEKQ